MFKKIFGVKSIAEYKKNYYIYDLEHPELQFDQLKLYPCQTTEWTQIKVVVNDYDSKKTVRGLAHVAEIPCGARGLGSGGHIREWHTPLISSRYGSCSV